MSDFTEAVASYFSKDFSKVLSTAVRPPAPLELSALYGGNLPDAVSDVIYRVSRTSSSMEVTAWPTERLGSFFNSGVDHYQNAISLLRLIVSWQRERLDYSSIHTAFLLGAISEDEFEAESDRFASEPKTLTGSEVAIRISQIDEALGDCLSTADYADFLGVEIESIVEALSDHIRLEGHGASFRCLVK